MTRGSICAVKRRLRERLRRIRESLGLAPSPLYRRVPLSGESWVDGAGRRLVGVHSASACEGQGCAIHHPSDHHMKDWPTNFRADRQIMERVCPHGVGHPDPDDVAYRQRVGIFDATGGYAHGCDSCCTEPGLPAVHPEGGVVRPGTPAVEPEPPRRAKTRKTGPTVRKPAAGQVWASTAKRDARDGVRQRRVVVLVDNARAYLRTLPDRGKKGRVATSAIQLTADGRSIRGYRFTGERLKKSEWAAA